MTKTAGEHYEYDGIIHHGGKIEDCREGPGNLVETARNVGFKYPNVHPLQRV